MVPVLPYRSGRFKVPWARAAVPERVTSCNRLVMMKALRGSMARIDSPGGVGLVSESTFPRCSATLLISQGLTRYPPLAKTEKAVAICMGVTEPAPSAIVRYGRCFSSSNPKRVTHSRAYAGPIACRMRIDTMFLDLASAVRMLMGPSNLPS